MILKVNSDMDLDMNLNIHSNMNLHMKCNRNQEPEVRNQDPRPRNPGNKEPRNFQLSLKKDFREFQGIKVQGPPGPSSDCGSVY